jgi:hypothetical protein
MRRRRLLAVSAGLFVGASGCLAGSGVLYAGSGQVTIENNSYEQCLFNIPNPATIDYTAVVISGSAIDTVVLTGSDFESFETGNAAQYVNSQLDIYHISVETNLTPKEWVLVLDNPHRMDTTVALEYEIRNYIPYGEAG